MAVYFAGRVRLSFGSTMTAFVMPFCVRPMRADRSRASDTRYSSVSRNGSRQVVGSAT